MTAKSQPRATASTSNRGRTADQIGATSHRRKEFTAEPPRAADVSQLQPEFCRVPDVQRVFGLRRGTLYRLIGEGKIRSVSLRERGHRTGVRLIAVASVRDFLNSLEGNAA